jgi:hypothetical protein
MAGIAALRNDAYGESANAGGRFGAGGSDAAIALGGVLVSAGHDVDDGSHRVSVIRR